MALSEVYISRYPQSHGRIAMVRTLSARVGVVSLVVGPLLIAGGDLMHPKEDADAADQAAIVLDHASRWYAAHLLIFAGLLLFVPGILVLADLASARRPRLGYLARILSLAGLAGFATIVGFEMLLGRLAQDGADRDTLTAVLDTFQSGPMFGVLAPFALTFFVGTGVVVYVLASQPGPYRWLSLAVGAGAALVLVEILSSIVVFSQVGNVVLLVAGAGFAWNIVRQSESEYTGGA